MPDQQGADSGAIGLPQHSATAAPCPCTPPTHLAPRTSLPRAARHRRRRWCESQAGARRLRQQRGVGARPLLLLPWRHAQALTNQVRFAERRALVRDCGLVSDDAQVGAGAAAGNPRVGEVAGCVAAPQHHHLERAGWRCHGCCCNACQLRAGSWCCRGQEFRALAASVCLGAAAAEAVWLSRLLFRDQRARNAANQPPPASQIGGAVPACGFPALGPATFTFSYSKR